MGVSVVATVAPQIFPPNFRRMDGAVAVYFEAAAIIVVLVLLGQLLELRAREATGGTIRALLDLAPRTARRLKPDGSEEEVALELVAAGDSLRVRPGEAVPVDGTVTDWRTTLDESLVTGESMPVTKEIGDTVIAGTINQTGAIAMRADKVGRDTMLARIVQIVADAQRSRTPIQRLADEVSGWFVPAAIGVAVLAFAVWAIFGPEPRFTFGFVAAVTVLIIVCPCALGLATPMPIMVGVGRGAASGVLVKNAGPLERMEKVDTLLVDKTGTLTEGKPKVVAIEPFRGIAEDELLRFATAVERPSQHPLAAAIVAEAATRKLALETATAFDAPIGKGVIGTIDSRRVAIGNLAYLSELGVDTAALTEAAERHRREGATAILMAIDGKAAGVIAIADPVKATTADALASPSIDAHRPKALAEKSRSSTSCSILERSLSISVSPLARATSEAPAKVDAIPSIACRFHAAIIVGWMPCLLPSSASVRSPRIASSATLL